MSQHNAALYCWRVADPSGTTEEDDADDVAYENWRKDWTREDWDRARAHLPIRRYTGPDFDRLVGQNVQTFRNARGLSQADLASALSSDGEIVHQQTIQKIEKGTRPMRYSEAVRICDALGVSPMALTDNGEKARNNAWFIKTLGEVSAVRSTLESTADQLAKSLVILADLLAHNRLESDKTHKADLHLVDGAKLELKRNWGKLLNQEIMDSLRAHPELTVIREEVDASTYLEILQLRTDEIRLIEPDDPYPTEPRKDESEA